MIVVVQRLVDRSRCAVRRILDRVNDRVRRRVDCIAHPINGVGHDIARRRVIEVDAFETVVFLIADHAARGRAAKGRQPAFNRRHPRPFGQNDQCRFAKRKRVDVAANLIVGETAVDHAGRSSADCRAGDGADHRADRAAEHADQRAADGTEHAAFGGAHIFDIVTVNVPVCILRHDDRVHDRDFFVRFHLLERVQRRCSRLSIFETGHADFNRNHGKPLLKLTNSKHQLIEWISSLTFVIDATTFILRGRPPAIDRRVGYF